MNLALQLPDDVVDEIARRAAAMVLERLGERTSAVKEFLTPDEAAEYLGCAKQRIYDLRSQGRLRAYRDGGRALVKQSELDAHLGLEEALPLARRRRRVA